MRRLDTRAIDRIGIPRLLLMDHAGLAIARAVRTLAPSSGLVLACCGTGYNGGDGLAALRHLSGWGYAVRALIAGGPEQLREEPATFARLLARLGVPVDAWTPGAGQRRASSWFTRASVIIDALLGVGARGAAREPVAAIIRRINAAGRPVVCADVPSGVDADTGAASGDAVQGTMTVTFGVCKRGLATRAGRRLAGRLVVDPITLPIAWLEHRAR